MYEKKHSGVSLLIWVVLALLALCLAGGSGAKTCNLCGNRISDTAYTFKGSNVYYCSNCALLLGYTSHYR